MTKTTHERSPSRAVARACALLLALACATALPARAEPTATAAVLDLTPDLELSGAEATDAPLPADAAGQHRIYASLPPVFALLERLVRGMEEFEPLQLVQPQLDCVRLYELSDWDYIQLSGAETCVIWGGGLESFGGALTSAESGPAVITLSDAPAEYDLAADMEDYDYYGHYSDANPNSYLSAARISATLDALSESLSALYPAYSEQIALNYADARALVDEALAELDALRADATDEVCAALYEGAPYALDELGLSWTYAYPREPAADVTGADLDELLTQLSATGASVAVLERQAPSALTEALRAAGYEVRLMSTLTTLNEPTLEELISALLANARALCGAE